MPKRTLELKVGLFILVPIVILFSVIILKMGYSFATRTIDVYLKIDNIKMIKEGTAVKVKGYSVGRVVSIQPVYNPELHFLALMRIQKSVNLYEDCVAVIQNQNVIGEAIIELRNPEKKGDFVRNGDVLEAVEYVSVEALMNDVHKLLMNINDTVSLVRVISFDNKGDIKAFVSGLASTISTINKTTVDSQGDILGAVSSLRKTSDTMKEIADELKKHPVKFLLKD